MTQHSQRGFRAMTISGDLLSVDLSNVFQMLAMNRKRGLVHLHNRENILQKRCLILDESRIAALDVAPPTRGSGLMLASGSIEGDVYFDARAAALARGASIEDELAQRGLFDEEIQASVAQLSQEEAILEVFLWKNVAFSLDENWVPSEDSRRVFFPVDLVIMEAARRQDEWERVRGSIGIGHDVFVPRQGFDPEPLLAELDPVSRLVFDHLDGVQGAAEIQDAIGLPAYFVDSAIGALVDLELAKRMTLDDLLITGDGMVREGRHDDAVRLYSSALRFDRRAIAVHKRMASVHESMGRVAKAAMHYKVCARELVKRDHNREAFEIYQHVAVLIPTDFKAIARGLRLLAQLEEYHEADGDFVESARELFRFFYDAGWLSKAEAILQDLLVILPQDLQLGFAMAKVYVKTGRIGEATRAYLHLATRLREAEDYEGAVAAYKIVASFDTEAKQNCLQKVEEIHALMARRKRRRAAVVALTVGMVFAAIAAVAYFVYHRSANAAMDELRQVEAKARFREDYVAVADRYEELKASYPLTLASLEAEEARVRCRSEVERLREEERVAEVASREARTLRLAEARRLASSAQGHLAKSELRRALAQIDESLSLGSNVGTESWAEAPKLEAIRDEIRRQVELEDAALERFSELRSSGQPKEAYEILRPLLRPRDPLSLEDKSDRIVGVEARLAKALPFELVLIPAQASGVDEEGRAWGNGPITLEAGQMKRVIRVSCEGYLPGRLEISRDGSSYRQVMILDRQPERSISVGARARNLEELQGGQLLRRRDESLWLSPAGAEFTFDFSSDFVVDASFGAVVASSEGQLRVIDPRRQRRLFGQRFNEGIRALESTRTGVLLLTKSLRPELIDLDLETAIREGVMADPVRWRRPLPRGVDGVWRAGERIAYRDSEGRLGLLDATKGRPLEAPSGRFDSCVSVGDAFLLRRGKTLLWLAAGSVEPKSVVELAAEPGFDAQRFGSGVIAGCEDGALIEIDAQGVARRHEGLAGSATQGADGYIVDIGQRQCLLRGQGGRLLHVDLEAGRLLAAFGVGAEGQVWGGRWGDQLVVLRAGSGQLEVQPR